MVNLFQRHYSDESLICHLDGELPFYSRAAVRRHLERCWRCRLRLSEIESQVLLAVRAMENDAFPGPERIAAARLKFLNRADQIAAEVRYARTPYAWLHGPRALAWAAAALVLVCALSVWRSTPGDARAVAVAALGRVEAAEAHTAQLPSHQRFRVVEKQLRPATVSRENHLEVWSEPARGRFATSFSDMQGVVRHAMWQPAPDRQYVYRAARSATVVRVSREQAQENWDLLRDGVTLEEVEGQLLTWLERRSWRPVSFTKALASLASADGTVLTVREIRQEGRPLIRLNAQRTVGAVVMEFVLDLDKRTYTPRLQSVRYESPARSLELQLYSEDPPPSTPASFEPPARLVDPHTGDVPMPATLEPAPLALPPPNHSMMEAEIHRALHSVRACLGETIEVESGQNGRFTVRGVVGGPERKEQLTAALAALADSRLSIEIKSAQEILRELRPDSISPGVPLEHAAPPRPGHALAWLAASLGGREPEAEAFAERVLSSGEEFMRDAQALRQLGHTFGGRSEFESAPLRGLVLAIEYDHLKDLQTRTQATRHLLEPILPASTPPPGGVVPTSLRWDEELRRIFELATGLNERLRGLLAGADPNVRPDRQLLEIADAFQALQSAVAGAAVRATPSGGTERPF